MENLNYTSVVNLDLVYNIVPSVYHKPDLEYILSKYLLNEWMVKLINNWMKYNLVG